MIFVMATLVLSGCAATSHEVQFERNVMVISHTYFGLGWLTIYEKDTAYERDGDAECPDVCND